RLADRAPRVDRDRRDRGGAPFASEPDRSFAGTPVRRGAAANESVERRRGRHRGRDRNAAARPGTPRRRLGHRPRQRPARGPPPPRPPASPARPPPARAPRRARTRTPPLPPATPEE